MDFDDRETFSEVVYAVVFSDEEAVSLFPNPAQNEFFLKFENLPAETVQVHLSNPQGQLVNTWQLKGDEQVHRLDISGLPPGAYLVKIQTEHSVFLHKLLIP